MRSVISLENDNLGYRDRNANVIEISKYTTESGEQVNEVRYVGLPADACRDSTFVDWLISDKTVDSQTDDAFMNLLQEKNEELNKIKPNLSGLLKRQLLSANYSDQSVAKIDFTKTENSDPTLQRMVELYGEDTLKQMDDKEFYRLFKAHY